MTLRKTPPRRVTIREMIERKESMLGTLVPDNYGAIETVGDAIAVAVPKADVILRVTIVWDNETSNFPLDLMLQSMRETGAAMVISVEQVS